MKSDWKQVTLNDVTDILGDGIHGTPEYSQSGEYAFINGNNLVNGQIQIKDSTKRVDLEQFIEYKKPLSNRTILVSINGTLGNVAIYRGEKVILGKSACYFNVSENISKDFIRFVVVSPAFQNYLQNQATGTTIKNVSLKQMREYPFLLPPIETQKSITEILLALNDKIELNQKINENLEQQAIALFNNFYDHAETEVSFTDAIQILGGGTPKTGESLYWNSGVPFFTPKDAGYPYTLTTEKTITEEGLAHCNSRLYPINTVFVTARGTVGKVSMFGVSMAMNQSCYALAGKDTHQLLVYFYTLKVVERLKHKASGAVFDAITTRDFASEQIMKLSNDDAEAFLCVAEPMYQAILNNCVENLRLAALRDSLLPKLMSGEIDITNISGLREGYLDE